MSSAIEKFDVVCPLCGEEYSIWHRPSLGTFMPLNCPHCNYELLKDRTVQNEGIWSLARDDQDPARQ